MKTEENGTITLSHKEEVAIAHRDTMLSFGESVEDAARSALDHMEGQRNPTKKFAEWLSAGALTVTNGEVVATEQPGEESTEEESDSDDEAGDEEQSSSKAEPVSV